MVFVSTGGFSDKRPIDASQEMIEVGITDIELSSGIDENIDLNDFIKLKDKCNFQIHNYFPPPKDPFVFNLASLDQDIAKLSFEHAKTAIQWAYELDNPTYSFHAGFLIDPKVNELGKRIKSRKPYDRQESLLIFIDRVNMLSMFIEEMGGRLLIENNVLSMNNYQEFKFDPFLMSTPEECKFVMEHTDENVNLLIDVAHLKVSANSLDYNPLEMFNLCDPWIKAYHFSDNDGLSDSNNLIDEDSWFWPHIKKDLDYYSIEVYGETSNNLLQLKGLVESSLKNL